MIADVQGKQYTIGCKVARAAKLYVTDGLYVEIVVVTKIDDGKLYINNHRQPVRFPERMCIIG